MRLIFTPLCNRVFLIEFGGPYLVILFWHIKIGSRLEFWSLANLNVS